MPMSVTAYRGDEQRRRKGVARNPLPETISSAAAHPKAQISRSSATQERVQCLYEGQKLYREVITTT
jgi:hypothetical protein